MATTMATEKTKKKLVLHTFPPVPNSYSFSPFSLKVESFLRINTIPYDTLYTSSFGKNKTIPYLRIFESDQNETDSNNAFDEVSDSNEIIAFLLTNPDYDTSLCEEENLTREQKAISHSCLRMLEEHTAQTGFYYRYHLNMPEFCEATQVRERVFMGDESKMGSMIFGFFKKALVKGWGKKAAARGYMRYSSPDVVWAMACEDLQALEDLLASTTPEDEDQTYFFGRAHPGVLDCTVFGHLSQFLYIAIDDFPHKIYLQENCPTLLRFMEWFKATHFPDWDTLCQRQPNDGLRANNPRVLAMQQKMKCKALSAMAVMVGVVSVVYQIYRKHSKGAEEE